MKAVGWIEGNGTLKWLGNKPPESFTTLFVETPVDPNEQHERKVLGYTLEPIYEIPDGAIATAAFILCHSCNSPISGHGGPRYNAVCLKCVEHLNFTNLIKG